MDQPRILMCPPDYYGIEYEINPWMSTARGSDHALARRQWQALKDILSDLGARIEEVASVAGLPDLVFTANAGLVYHDLFVASRFRFGVRQGETPLFSDWARGHGFEVVELPRGLYHEGAGDALFCGATLFAGYRFRSAARSHHWVAERLGVEVLPLELVDARYYHLDTCFCPLSAAEAMYYPGAFDDYGRSVLSASIPRLIEVSADESSTFSCNAVVVGRDVVLNAGAPRLSRSLAAAGYRTHPVELGEFIKSGGSAKCLTLRLDGEDAAAWKHAVVATSASGE